MWIVFVWFLQYCVVALWNVKLQWVIITGSGTHISQQDIE